MSTKTIKQRIAVVAVSALTAGFLSVVSTSAANAAVSTGATAGELYISTTASATGSAAPNSGAYSTSTTSTGWIAETSASAATAATGGLKVTSGAYSANVYAGAEISFAASNSATSAGVTVKVTGGTLLSVGQTSGTTLTLTGDKTTATIPVGSTADTLHGVFRISAAAGSTATLAAYSGAGVGVTTPTSGALLGLWSFTVVGASTVGVYDAGESTVTQQPCITKAGTSSSALAYDTTSRCANGTVGVIYVDLEDAYTGDVSGGTLAASATGGSNVYIEDTGAVDANDAYLAVTAYDTETAADTNWIVVTQPVANTAGSTTVTISYLGTVVGTKTINWTGDVAKISVLAATSSAIKNAATDSTLASGINSVYYTATDAAGNIVTLAAQPSVSGATGSMVGAATSTTTLATIAAVQDSSVGYGYTTIDHPGGILQGAGSYKLKLTNSAGTAIYSDEQKVTVSSGSTASFTASWDKAVYNPGEIATLTITLKDAYGNVMASGTTMTGLTDGLLPPGTATAGFAPVGSTCVDGSTVTAGVRTCKYGAGNVAGAYNWSVDLGTPGGANQSAVIGSISISAGSAVSNADVLKSIVALIASINKQIQALQKLILKR
jgi:hypothetical protein